MDNNTESLNTLDDVRGLFIEWTGKMDKLYGEGTQERTNSKLWTKGSPKEWMSPFKQDLFDIWLHYDMRIENWEKEAEKIINEPSLLEALENEDDKTVKEIADKMAEGKRVRLI